MLSQSSSRSGTTIPFGCRAQRADHGDHDQLDDRHPERLLRLRPRPEPDDVERVDHRRHEDQGLAVPDREAAQGQHRQPHHRHHHGRPGDPADPAAQDQGGEHRGGHDVHPGDEAGHAGRGLGEPGRLEDLRDAVEAAEHHGLAARLAGEPAEGARREEDQGEARDREPDRQEVEGRHPLEEVVDQEEGRAPAGGDRQQRRLSRGASYVATWGRWAPHHASGQTILQDDGAPLGRLVTGARGRARDVAQAEVEVGVLDLDLEAEALQLLGRGLDAHRAEVARHLHELGALRHHELHGVAVVEHAGRRVLGDDAGPPGPGRSTPRSSAPPAAGW